MMASQQWGRKETVIFPPHSAIYTYGAVFLAFVMTGCFLYVRFAYGQTNATGMRVLQTIVAAVPVRLMKRDFFFISEQLLPLLDDKRLEIVARNRGIRAKEGESAAKLLSAFLRKAEEGVIGKLIVESVILLSASKQADGGKLLRAAAQAYKVDTDAIGLKVKHEFAAKEKARSAARVELKPVPKALKKTA